jgi:hypothetical protein
MTRAYKREHTTPLTVEDMIEMCVLGAVYFCDRKGSCPAWMSGSDNAHQVGIRLDLLMGRAEWHGWRYRTRTALDANNRGER